MPGLMRGALAVALMAIAGFVGTAAAACPLHRTPRAALPKPVADLPLVVTAAPVSPKPFVVWISGDGGWGEMERDVSRLLQRDGAPMVGVNTLRYFWLQRRPEEVAAALDRIVRAYAPAFGRDRFVLVGFSFGADMAPLVIDRLSPDVRARMDRAVFLSPARRAAYEVGPATWFGVGDKDEVGPAIARLRSLDIVCVRGARDPLASCPTSSATRYTIVDLPGGHTLKGDWPYVARLVLGKPPA
ncbi:MAG: virulence factor [Alphaproteobacteria bacterium]|nr:virulence factor [Alphaproteobacteria bacterium]